VIDVHEVFRISQSKTQQRDEAMPSSQNLRIITMRLKKPYNFLQAVSRDIVETRRNQTRPGLLAK
jgi:hypothetical protein